LRHLGPGDGAHAAEKGTDQDAGQPDEYADLEFEPDEAAGDQTDAVDLRHDIGEGREDGGEHADHACGVAAVTRAEEVRNGVFAELAQIGRKQQRHQTVAAGPADDEGEPLIAAEIERAGEADEGRGGHPVGAGGHAIEHGRHPAAGDVVLGHVGGAAHDADAGIQRDGGEHEHIAYPARRHAHAFGHRQQGDEHGKAAGIPGIHLLELPIER
jgi:hypothetical protein